jgi:polyhydroxybutyrate depolymerase
MPRKEILVAIVAAIGVVAECAAAADVSPRPSAGCSKATIETGRRLERTVEVDGVRRAYILDVPESIQPKTPVPLLFDFHGFGHSAAGVWEVSKFHALAARDGFITIYPDGLPVHLLGRDDLGWEIFTITNNRDMAFTRRLMDEIEQTYCIDEARVFATGFSNGAYFSNILGCTMSDRFAAIAPVSGGRLTLPCAPPRGVPVLIHHGRNDALIDVQQGREARDAWVQADQCHTQGHDACEWHRGCRNDVEVVYCEDDGVHHWPEPATERIWKFFKRYPMPARQ